MTAPRRLPVRPGTAAGNAWRSTCNHAGWYCRPGTHLTRPHSAVSRRRRCRYSRPHWRTASQSQILQQLAQTLQGSVGSLESIRSPGLVTQILAIVRPCLLNHGPRGGADGRAVLEGALGVLKAAGAHSFRW